MKNIRLPKALIELVLDYYYSYKQFQLHRKLLRELSVHFFFREVRAFYEVFNHITVSFRVNGLTLLEQEYNSDDDILSNLP